MDGISALGSSYRPTDLSYSDTRTADPAASGASFQSLIDEASKTHDPNIIPVNTPPKPAAPDQTTPDGHIMDGKIQGQLASRGWTSEAIDRAVRHGDRIDAVNKYTGQPATRYVDPKTGQSVIIDNATNRVIQVGEPGYRFGPESGDVPGAQMRPPPSPLAPTDEAVPKTDLPDLPEIPPLELPPI